MTTSLKPEQLLPESDATPPAGEWDDRLRSLNGHLLQSWRWGEFKSLQGWSAERIALHDGSALMQVLFRRKGPVSVAYAPRGPAFDNDQADLDRLFAATDEVCRRHRALYLILELERSLPTGSMTDRAGWRNGPEHFQPGRTVKVELGDDEQMLKAMHQKTRYSVRLAMRKGVEVERFEGMDEEGLHTFYRLLSETSTRNEFGVHQEAYYRNFLRVFDSSALLLIARVNGLPAAGLIAAAFGQEAIYIYGGSSAENRAHGAAFLLQFEAMRWARDKGLKRYDLWGIPARDPEPAAEATAEVPATKGDDWRGLHRFKMGFGGSVIDYPPTLERQYHPLAARVAHRYVRGIG